jgi:hypothetical protein
MTANALIFKSTIYPKWYVTSPLLSSLHNLKYLQSPQVHGLPRSLVHYYVPIQNVYSDLYDALVFFCGDLAGRRAHEELVVKIVEGME